jgi:hypothetical protein
MDDMTGRYPRMRENEVTDAPFSGQGIITVEVEKGGGRGVEEVTAPARCGMATASRTFPPPPDHRD